MLKRVEFKRLCAKQLGADHGMHVRLLLIDLGFTQSSLLCQTFDALFELFDSDGNGAIDMKECVSGLSALGTTTSAESTLQWIFEVFRCACAIEW